MNDTKIWTVEEKLKSLNQQLQAKSTMKTYDPSQPSPMSILFRGPPGGGKTTLGLQWPDLWLANCDNNLDGPVRFLKKKNLYRPFKYDDIAKDDKGAPITDLAVHWPRLIDKTDAAIADPTIQTIFIDSLTHIDRILFEYIFMKNKTDKAKGASFPEYNMFKTLLYGYLTKIKAAGKTLLVACHEKIEYGQDFKVEAYVPAISTNLKDYFEYLFTDQWLCEIRPDGAGTVKAFVVTHPTATRSLKNSLLLPSAIEATYDAVAKALAKPI